MLGGKVCSYPSSSPPGPARKSSSLSPSLLLPYCLESLVDFYFWVEERPELGHLMGKPPNEVGSGSSDSRSPGLHWAREEKWVPLDPSQKYLETSTILGSSEEVKKNVQRETANFTLNSSPPNGKYEEVGGLESRGKEKKCSLEEGCVKWGSSPTATQITLFLCSRPLLVHCPQPGWEISGYRMLGPPHTDRKGSGTRVTSLTLWPSIQNFLMLPEETRNYSLQISASNWKDVRDWRRGWLCVLGGNKW